MVENDPIYIRAAAAIANIRGPKVVTTLRTPLAVESLYPCPHLGPVIERKDAAGLECNCAGKWLRSCGVHGQCRIDQESPDGCCRTCEQRPGRNFPQTRQTSTNQSI